MTDALEIFRALADPTRLRILALLRAMELSIGELAQVLGQSQPRVSRHVKILADAGIAERRKEGKQFGKTLCQEGCPPELGIHSLQRPEGPKLAAGDEANGKAHPILVCDAV